MGRKSGLTCRLPLDNALIVARPVLFYVREVIRKTSESEKLLECVRKKNNNKKKKTGLSQRGQSRRHSRLSCQVQSVTFLNIKTKKEYDQKHNVMGFSPDTGVCLVLLFRKPSGLPPDGPVTLSEHPERESGRGGGTHTCDIHLGVK